MAKKKGLRQKLYEKCWKLMSEIVRRLEKGACYTCGAKKDWKYECNAGHFKHGKLDFDFINIHCQCIRCNKHLGGKLDVYAEKLLKEYGEENFLDLCMRANQFTRYEIHELESILENLKDVKNNLDDLEA